MLDTITPRIPVNFNRFLWFAMLMGYIKLRVRTEMFAAVSDFDFEAAWPALAGSLYNDINKRATVQLQKEVPLCLN